MTARSKGWARSQHLLYALLAVASSRALPLLLGLVDWGRGHDHGRIGAVDGAASAWSSDAAHVRHRRRGGRVPGKCSKAVTVALSPFQGWEEQRGRMIFG